MAHELKRAQKLLPRGGAALLGIAALIGIALLLFQLQGLAPTRALPLLVRGAFGSVPAWIVTLRVFAPLLLCTAGVLLAFRCGLWNIGAEGQFLVGALAGVAAGLATGHWLPALLAGSAAGFAWAFVAGWLALVRRVPEVLSTLMLNGVAFELLRWLVSGPLQEATHQFPQTASLPAAARLPGIEVVRAGALHLGLVIALLAVLLLGLLLARTRIGLVLRAGAQSPRLVRAAGHPLTRWQIVAFGASGAMAGLAGAIEVTGVAGMVDRSLAQGMGYAAVAAALLAGLRPWATIPAALLFAALATGTSALQWAENLPGIDRFGLVLQGLVILAVLVAARRARGAIGSA